MGGLRNPIRQQLSQGMERRMLARSDISRENLLQPAKTLAERLPTNSPGNQIPSQRPIDREKTQRMRLRETGTGADRTSANPGTAGRTNRRKRRSLRARNWMFLSCLGSICHWRVWPGSAKNPKSHPYPSQLGRIRGYEASSGGKCRIIYWFGCSWLAVDGLDGAR